MRIPIGPFEGLFVSSVALFTLIPWILVAITLADALRRPTWQWDAADVDQMVRTLVILSGGLIPFIGPVVYLTVARPKLRAFPRPPMPRPPTPSSRSYSAPFDPAVDDSLTN